MTASTRTGSSGGGKCYDDDDDDDFEIMLNGYKDMVIAKGEASDQQQQQQPVDHAVVYEEPIVAPVVQPIQDQASNGQSDSRSRSKSKSKSKKVVPGIHYCSDLEKENVINPPVPQWTETEDVKVKKLIHEAKKRFKSLFDKWQDEGPDMSEAEGMKKQLTDMTKVGNMDYQLYMFRCECYVILKRYRKAMSDIDKALVRIPGKNKQTFAKVYIRKADLMQTSGTHTIHDIFHMIEKAIETDASESFRLMCEEGKMPIYVRYAACLALGIAYDEDAKEAAFHSSTVKQALRHAVQKSNHYVTLVHSQYRDRNMDGDIDRMMCSNLNRDTFHDCIIGRVLRNLPTNKKNPSQLHDWFQELDTENMYNWTSLYVGNVGKNCRPDLQEQLSRYGNTECRVLESGDYWYSLNRYNNWMAPVFAMAELQGKIIPGISPADPVWGLEVKPKLKDKVSPSPKPVKELGAFLEFKRILASGPTGPDDILIHVEGEIKVKQGIQKIKRVDRMSQLTVAKLDRFFDPKKNQDHAEKSDEKGLNVYRMVGKPEVLESVLEPGCLILVANRDCLVSLSRMEWDERAKICSYHYDKNGYLITLLKRGFPDEFVDPGKKKETGTTVQEYRGNRYQEENYVPIPASNANPNTRDFLTLNEVILQNGNGFIKMLVCTEIDGELDGEYCEIKYKDSAIDQDDDKKADWCLFSKLAGDDLRLRIGEKRGNNIISHDFRVNQLLEDARVKAIYDRRVNLLFDNVMKVIDKSRSGQVYVADLGSLNPEYYKVLGDVEKYSELYEGKPLIPYELLDALDQFGPRY